MPIISNYLHFQIYILTRVPKVLSTNFNRLLKTFLLLLRSLLLVSLTTPQVINEGVCLQISLHKLKFYHQKKLTNLPAFTLSHQSQNRFNPSAHRTQIQMEVLIFRLANTANCNLIPVSAGHRRKSINLPPLERLSPRDSYLLRAQIQMTMFQGKVAHCPFISRVVTEI